MSNPFTFQPATRVGIKPLIGLYGESNSGKTFSALLLARGIAGPTGKVIGVDTESHRMSLYADEIPGGFQVAEFEPPFSPTRYMEALDAAEEAGADVIVFDSFSHEWFGEGGVLDMAAENENRGMKALSVWKTPKLHHARLVMRLLRSKTYVIICLRAKYKSRQSKGSSGKTEIVKDDHISPEQDEGLLFEMTAHCEMQTSDPGTIRLTKWSVPDLAECFPQDGKEKLGIKHGELIAKWANSGGKRSGPTIVNSQQPDDMVVAINDSTSTFELTQLVEDANKIEDEVRKKHIKSLIMRKSKQLKFTWDDKSQSFTDA